MFRVLVSLMLLALAQNAAAVHSLCSAAGSTYKVVVTGDYDRVTLMLGNRTVFSNVGCKTVPGVDADFVCATGGAYQVRMYYGVKGAVTTQVFTNDQGSFEPSSGYLPCD